jgi:hypothetical protein
LQGPLKALEGAVQGFALAHAYLDQKLPSPLTPAYASFGSQKLYPMPPAIVNHKRPIPIIAPKHPPNAPYHRDLCSTVPTKALRSTAWGGVSVSRR